MENKVSKTHERALRLVYDDSRNLPFEELLVKGNSVKKNLQTLATEIFKAKQRISPEIQFFKKPYNFRNNTTLQRKKTKPFILALNISHLYHLNMGNFSWATQK